MSEGGGHWALEAAGLDWAPGNSSPGEPIGSTCV